MIRKRRPAARTVRHDLEPLVEQVLLPEVFQNRPDRFDIFVLERDVSCFQVNPITDTVGQSFPFLDVGKRRLAAQRIEFIDTVGIDILFDFESQLFLDLDLNRQSVGIPPAAAADMEALHGLIPREDVLEDPRQDMVHPGFAISGWRTFIKDILWAAFTLIHGLVEDVM